MANMPISRALRAINDPDLVIVRSALRLDALTGDLYWRYREDRSRSWNTRYANKLAFTSKSKSGYFRGQVDGKVCFAHRVVFALAFGAFPDGFVDHINGQKNDNRPCNLRVVSRSQNNMNAKTRAKSSSKFKGVSWSKVVGKWHALSVENGKPKHLGYFTDERDAAQAYDNHASVEFGEYARLNNP